MDNIYIFCFLVYLLILPSKPHIQMIKDNRHKVVDKNNRKSLISISRTRWVNRWGKIRWWWCWWWGGRRWWLWRCSLLLLFGLEVVLSGRRDKYVGEEMFGVSLFGYHRWVRVAWWRIKTWYYISKLIRKLENEYKVHEVYTYGTTWLHNYFFSTYTYTKLRMLLSTTNGKSVWVLVVCLLLIPDVRR